MSLSAVGRSGSWTRSTVPVLLALALAGAAGVRQPAANAVPAAPGVLDPGLSTASSALTHVVVSGARGALASVTRAVQRVGGTANAPLPIVDGVSATVPADRLVDLTRQPGVRAVTADRAGSIYAATWDATTSNSPDVWTSQAGQLQSAGNKGAGVTVAVLDTGVTPVNDLSGRVLNGPDLSGENNNTYDSYGHGTVMAGIIAGSGADSQPSPYTGIAPAASIVSVKLAGTNGATDVSTVLAGLSWVGAFANTYGIKAVNLSWGVPSTQDPAVDPLDYAVERLWTSGITVVVAAGNNGPGSGTITKPADDPLVITVGAYDDRGDLNGDNDIVPNWSSQGSTAQGLAKPDLVAPGRTIIATRSPNSTVVVNNPKALVDPSYIKGSGTSEATAVTTGAVALLLAAHPTWTPDQVKAALVSTAWPIPGVATAAQGAGRIQVASAVNANVASVASASMRSTGLGPITGSRGSMQTVTVTCNGVSKVLNDESTSWCSTWDSSAWTSSAWTSSAWTSSAWTSSAWTSSAWTSSAWTSSAWTSSAWTSSAWTSSAWTSSAWTSSAWTSSAWTSAVYDDTDVFLDAFYGDHPPFWRHVPGEKSDPAPAFARAAPLQ